MTSRGSDHGLRVAICIATFQRLSLLDALLKSLGELDFRGVQPSNVLVVVVDNDARGSARGVVESRRSDLPVRIVYAVEPERNISLARNRAVELALQWRSDCIAFIDDDEVARPDWLASLLAARSAYAADVVAGPVSPRFAPDVPEWVIGGRFFARIQHPTGKRLRYAHTNNVLLDARVVRDPAVRFDPDFGLSGGGDTLFFMRLGRSGAKMVWSDEALVEEHIPRSRGSGEWLLRRAFRVGNGGVFCEKALAPNALWLVPRFVIALGRVAQGSLLLVPSLALGRAGAIRALWKIAYGLGCLSAFIGYRYYEYGRGFDGREARPAGRGGRIERRALVIGECNRRDGD